MSDAPRASLARDAGLGRRVATAAGWMVAFRWTDRLIGLGSVAVLARLLVPADFGIVGYAMLLIGLLELFADIATDSALIREESAGRDFFDAAWTMNLIKGIVLSGALVLLAPAAAGYFREPNLLPVVYCLAAMPILQAGENIGVVEFRRRLEFDRQFRFLLGSRLAGVTITLALAFALRNYWALVAGSLTRVTVRAILSYRMHPYRPRLAFARIPDIFRFSRWMMLRSLTSGLVDRVPTLFIGRAFGASALAFFNIGKEIADLSTTEVRAPIRSALYPGLSQATDRGDRMKAMLVESTGMLALLTVPVPLGIALVATDIVPLFLGSQWGATVELLRPLCIAAAIHGLDTNSHLAYMVTNRSYLTAMAACVKLALIVTFMWFLAPRLGLVGVAYALALASALVVVFDYALSARLLGIQRRRFVAAGWRPVVAALVMVAAVALLRNRLPAADDAAGHAVSLACSALLGAAVYVGAIFALWEAAGRPDGAERRVLHLLADLRARRRDGPQ